jgi:hypothetical protein
MEQLIKRVNKKFVEQEIVQLQSKLGKDDDTATLTKIQDLQKKIKR